MRKLRWGMYQTTLSSHPYRDSAIIYAGLGVLVVVIAAATGGSIVKAVIGGVVVFFAATLYSWWRVRQRLREQEREGR